MMFSYSVRKIGSWRWEITIGFHFAGLFCLFRFARKLLGPWFMFGWGCEKEYSPLCFRLGPKEAVALFALISVFTVLLYQAPFFRFADLGFLGGLPAKFRVPPEAPPVLAQTTFTLLPSSKHANDTSGAALSEVTSQNATCNPDTVSAETANDGCYTVDKGLVMRFSAFDVGEIPAYAVIVGATLDVRFGAEDGYNGTNFVRYDNGSGLTNTTIQPTDVTGWATREYSLFSAGVDTRDELATVDIEFTSNDGGAADSVSFDYVRINVAYNEPTFEQSAYRFFTNLDSTSVGSPLAAQDASTTLSSTGQAFRLRMLLHIGSADLASSSSWKDSAVETANDVGSYSSLDALDANNIFISHYDFTNGDLRFCKSTNGGSSWSCSAVDQPNAVGSYSSLDALDANNIFISHQDATNGDLRFCKSTNGGSSWSCSAVDQPNSVGSFSSLDAPDANNIFISHRDATNGDLRFCKSTNGGSSWSCSAVDQPNDVGWYTSLDALDANNIFISHHDATNGDLRFCKSTNGGSSWSSCSAVDQPNNVGQYTSLHALDANNIFISHRDATNGDLRFCKSTNGGSSWSCSAVDQPNDVGRYSSLDALDANNIFISHRDATNGDLRFCKSTDGGSSWSCSAVETANDVGYFSSLDAPDANNIFISHQDATNTDLRFAKLTDPPFKAELQFAQKSGTCDTSFSGENYEYVTASSTIAYNDNSAVGDGLFLTATSTDPSHAGHTNRNQTYEEANPFANASDILAGQDGLWDFSLKDNNASSSTSFCFRAVHKKDIATASYDNASTSVSQDGFSTGIFFKPDGTKMYMVGYDTDAVYQYSLSTPWSIATASYDNASKSVSAQDGIPNGVFFKPDGTKMYVVGSFTDAVYQYSLSTPWSIATASYDNASTSVSAQDSSPQDVFFKPDGTKMYMVGYGTDAVYQYSLSTPWSIATASYDNASTSVSQDGFSTGIFFKPDGTNMYMVGFNNGKVYQYSLSTPWSIATASYDNASESVKEQDTNANGVFFKPDGTKMYVVGHTNDAVYQYSTNILLDTYSQIPEVTTASAVNVSITLTTDGAINYGSLAASATKDTTPSGLNDTQIAQNNGEVTEDFNIRGYNTSCPWTLVMSPSPGADQYAHEFSTNGGTAWNFASTDYKTWETGVAVNATRDLDLRITMPSSSSCGGATQDASLTLQAVQQ